MALGRFYFLPTFTFRTFALGAAELSVDQELCSILASNPGRGLTASAPRSPRFGVAVLGCDGATRHPGTGTGRRASARTRKLDFFMQVVFIDKLSNLFHNASHFFAPGGSDLFFKLCTLRQQGTVAGSGLFGRFRRCCAFLEKRFCLLNCILLGGCHCVFR